MLAVPLSCPQAGSPASQHGSPDLHPCPTPWAALKREEAVERNLIGKPPHLPARTWGGFPPSRVHLLCMTVAFGTSRGPQYLHGGDKHLPTDPLPPLCQQHREAGPTPPINPLLSPCCDLHVWRHDVPGESGVVAPEQQAGGCQQGLGPQQEAQRGHPPVTRYVSAAPQLSSISHMISAPPDPLPSGPAQPGMLSPLGPR